MPADVIKLIPTTDALHDYINREPGVLNKWVAYLNGKPVGVATIEDPSVHGLNQLGNTQVLQVIVSPKARGHGIGEKLLKLAAEAKTVDHLAGYTHHSKGFEHLSKRLGIRNMDDVSNYDEESSNWKKDGSYEEDEEY